MNTIYSCGIKINPLSIDEVLSISTQSANGNVYKISGNSVLTNLKKVKYVKTTGNDANNGDSPNTAYATIYKALTEGASEIYIFTYHN